LTSSTRWKVDLEFLEAREDAGAIDQGVEAAERGDEGRRQINGLMLRSTTRSCKTSCSTISEAYLLHCTPPRNGCSPVCTAPEGLRD